MSTCTVCPLCDHPGTLTDTKDVGRIPCNVRKFKDEVFTMWRCTNCGSIHCAEDADLPAFYANYPVLNNELNGIVRRQYERRLKKLEHLGLSFSDRILDYGGGHGLFAQFLKEKGYSNAFCYDPWIPEFADAGLLERTYDAVCSYHSICQDDDSMGHLRNMAHLVRLGGIVMIMTTRADLLNFSETKRIYFHAPYNRHIFSEQALVEAARKQHLVPLGTSYSNLEDSLLPALNWHFVDRYIDESGGFMDVMFESVRYSVILKSPMLIFLAFFGYFFPTNNHLVIGFRKV